MSKKNDEDDAFISIDVTWIGIGIIFGIGVYGAYEKSLGLVITAGVCLFASLVVPEFVKEHRKKTGGDG